MADDDHGSEALTFTWDEVPTCAGFSFHHYLICMNDGPSASPPSAPTTPTGDCQVATTVRAATTKDLWVYRSDRVFAATIFACASTVGCALRYGSGDFSATITDKSVTGVNTEPERWLLVGISSLSDSDRVFDADTNGVEAMVYPTGFTHAGKLAVWYMKDVSNVFTIYYQRVTTSGWQDFSAATWTTATVVARESSGGGWYRTTNPWVVPATSGNGNYIRMFLQVHSGPDFEVKSIDSTSDVGDAFGLLCTTVTGCPVAVGGTCPYLSKCNWSGGGASTRNELGRDHTSVADFYLDHSGHGRIGWDTINEGPVDFSTDEPFMLFTGEGFTGTCNAGPDNVYVATWDSTAMDWAVSYTSSPACPAHEFMDAHDPYILPLPDGTFKGYYNIDREAGNTPYVCYSDTGAPTTWQDCVEITFGLDDSDPWDGSPSLSNGCMGDTAMFAMQDGSTRREGGFTELQSDCFSAGKGFVFIRHEN